MRRILPALVSLLLGGCLGIPKGIEPVRNFDVDSYLGIWYEIARLDHSFERGLDEVTATYSRRDDGGIRVVNRGVRSADQRWKEAEGRAYFVEDEQTAYLRVSFFGPFYGSYVVFDLDPDGQTAYVTSSSRDYLWLLARTPTVSDAVRRRFVERATTLGFAVDGLIFPRHGSTQQKGRP